MQQNCKHPYTAICTIIVILTEGDYQIQRAAHGLSVRTRLDRELRETSF